MHTRIQTNTDTEDDDGFVDDTLEDPIAMVALHLRVAKYAVKIGTAVYEKVCLSVCNACMYTYECMCF